MKAITFNKAEHYDVLVNWYEQRNLPVVQKEMLSDFGLIISNNNKLVVAGFLFPVLGVNWCFLEGAISNPDTTKEERAEALDLLISDLQKIAKFMGYKKACIISENSGIIKLLEKHNYTQSGKKNINFWGNL